jgi:uncharacterized membrane protein
MNEDAKTQPLRDAVQELPLNRLTEELQNLAKAMAERMLLSATGKVEAMTGRLTEYVAEGGGKSLVGALTGSLESGGASGLGKIVASPVKSALLSLAKNKVKDTFKSAFGLGPKGKKGGKVRVTNIVEMLDIGAPVRVVYNQWTLFEDFPSFMKKVEHVAQEADEKLSWKAQIFWSHRSWQSEIVEQVPDERIIWRSKGPKGYVDGAVSFGQLAPDITRVVLVLEYHPQGMFEHTGNIWRAQGRRARLEFKHFARHTMTQAMLHPDEIEGWRGEIHEGRVVKDHETALREEREQKVRDQEPEEGLGPEEEEYEGREEAQGPEEGLGPEEEYEGLEEGRGPEEDLGLEEEEEYEGVEKGPGVLESEEVSEEEEYEEPEEERVGVRGGGERRAYEEPERKESPVRRRRPAPEEERPSRPAPRRTARRS